MYTTHIPFPQNLWVALTMILGCISTVIATPVDPPLNEFSPPQSNESSFCVLGTIVGKDQQPIETGSVQIRLIEDSSFVKGNWFQQGELLVCELTTPTFLLHIQAVGYEELFRIVEKKEEEAIVELGSIQLRELSISAVSIIGRQPLLQQRGDRVIVDVAHSFLGQAGTAMDVLQNSPKITLNSANQLSVVGKGAALIYVDGQRIASMEMLQSLSSTDIKHIEIIENPPARYDAEGNAIINIITQNSQLRGTKFTLTQEVEQRKFFRTYHQLRGYHKTPRWMLQASYGIRHFGFGGREHYFRTMNTPQTQLYVENRYTYRLDNVVHDLSLRSTYDIGAQSKIGLQYSGLLTQREKSGDNRSAFDENQVPNFRMNTLITGPSRQKSHTFGAFWETQLDTLGSQIVATGQYARFDLDRRETIDQVLVTSQGETSFLKRNHNLNNIGVFSLQLDLDKYFPNGAQWSSGIKNVHISNQSALLFEREQADEMWVEEPHFSNAYDYAENIWAAYTQFAFEPWGGKATMGLRGEWTKTEGVSARAQPAALFSRDYFNFFPSLSFQKPISQNLTAGVNYGYRIQRPRFQDLNPFVFYVDSLVSVRGNAQLAPEYSHNLSASLTHKAWTFQLNYAYVRDKINMLIEIPNAENPSVFDMVRDNIEQSSLLTATLTLPIQASWYSSSTILGGRSETFRFTDRGKLVTNQKPGFYIFTNHSFQLPRDITLELTYRYTSPRVDGIYTDRPISALSIAASRTFFNKHLTVRILGNDLFDNFKFRGTSQFYGNEWRYLSEGDWHFVKLSLVWNFGRMGVGSMKDQRISQEELQRISQ